MKKVFLAITVSISLAASSQGIAGTFPQKSMNMSGLRSGQGPSRSIGKDPSNLCIKGKDYLDCFTSEMTESVRKESLLKACDSVAGGTINGPHDSECDEGKNEARVGDADIANSIDLRGNAFNSDPLQTDGVDWMSVGKNAGYVRKEGQLKPEFRTAKGDTPQGRMLALTDKQLDITEAALKHWKTWEEPPTTPEIAAFARHSIEVVSEMAVEAADAADAFESSNSSKDFQNLKKRLAVLTAAIDIVYTRAQKMVADHNANVGGPIDPTAWVRAGQESQRAKEEGWRNGTLKKYSPAQAHNRCRFWANQGNVTQYESCMRSEGY